MKPSHVRCALFFAGVFACPWTAFAQLDDAAAASRAALLTQAQQAQSNGEHERALDYAQRAGRLQMSPSLRLFIARELRALGRLAPALGAAQQCVREIERDTQAQNREQIQGACRAMVAEVEPLVGHLILRIASPLPPTLQVQVNGVEVPRELWDVPYLVTPGTITVEAHAAGFDARTQRVTVVAGAPHIVEVSLTRREETPPNREVSEGPGPAPWIVVGVGGALALSSAGFYAGRESALADRAAACGGNASDCVPTGTPGPEEHHNRAVLFNALSIASLSVGVATAAAGVTWFLLARPRARSTENTETTARWAPYALPGSAGVLVSF